jgi:glycosyltransferase involved in cell wall biosynthesis
MNQIKQSIFISIDGMTDPLGQSQVIPYLQGLSKADYKIHIVSAEKQDNFEANKDKIQNILDISNIKWHPILYKSSPPILSSLNNIEALFKTAEKIHLQQNVQLIHCRSYLPMFAGLKLKKKYGIKVLFDIRGFWPDERVDGGLWKLTNPLWNLVYRYFKRKEKVFFEQADHTITLTEVAKEEIHHWKLKNNPIPIDVIPCCADLDHFNFHNIQEKDKLALKKELKLENTEFILSYLGSVGTFYALDEMMTFFEALQNKISNAKFLVITASPPTTVWEAASRQGISIEDIRVVKSPREKVPLYLSISDYSLIFYKENFSRKACSPTKLGELMGLGIPSVCSPNIGDTTEIIHQTKAGLVLNALETSYFNKMAEQIAVQSFNKNEIRQASFQFFDVKEGIEKYIAVYKKMIG